MHQKRHLLEFSSNFKAKNQIISLNVCFANHKNLFNTMSTAITIVEKYHHYHDNYDSEYLSYYCPAVPYTT